ncbi:MAG: AtpZ/AtpI family protein [Lachnospiraceae bacterium]
MKDKKVLNALAIFSQITITMLVPIMLCAYIGYLIDQKLGVSFSFIIGFFLGALAGFRNVYYLMKKQYDSKDTSPSELYGNNKKKDSKLDEK